MLQVLATSRRGHKKVYYRGRIAPAFLSRWCLVRFALLVGLRHSYYYARTTGPDFVLRSHGRWAKRTEHGHSLGTTVRSLSRTPFGVVCLGLQSMRVIECLWVGKENTSQLCVSAPRSFSPRVLSLHSLSSLALVIYHHREQVRVENITKTPYFSPVACHCALRGPWCGSQGL